MLPEDRPYFESTVMRKSLSAPQFLCARLLPSRFRKCCLDIWSEGPIKEQMYRPFLSNSLYFEVYLKFFEFSCAKMYVRTSVRFVIKKFDKVVFVINAFNEFHVHFYNAWRHFEIDPRWERGRSSQSKRSARSSRSRPRKRATDGSRATLVASRR